MNVDGFRVIIRAWNTFISARLEFENQRAFAVTYDSRLNDAKEVVGRARMGNRRSQSRWETRRICPHQFEKNSGEGIYV